MDKFVLLSDKDKRAFFEVAAAACLGRGEYLLGEGDYTSHDIPLSSRQECAASDVAALL